LGFRREISGQLPTFALYFLAMSNTNLMSISPVDGRYGKITEPLAIYFSEFGLFRYRIKVEIEYFIFLGTLSLPEFPAPGEKAAAQLRKIYDDFTVEDALKIKEFEIKTNHDVKAVEYFIKEKLAALGIGDRSEFVHFGLTSQDINNTAVPLSLKDALKEVVFPFMEEITELIGSYASAWKDIPMLARTHGQPASPTMLGKEFAVFHERIRQQYALLDTIPFNAKFGGASGGLNAHYVAFPQVDWNREADRLIHSLGLKRSRPTTQIEHYDNLAALFDNLKRINTILIDLCRDIWHYISIEYFKQMIQENEVGSSTMPHKVNPIDFENAEGNFAYANAIYEFFSAKLPVSRLQRDLTDSTVLRNIGMPLSHTMIALNSLKKGLNKLQLNEEALTADLEKNWVVISEGIQTILRRAGYPNPYEELKQLTRKNKKINKEAIHEFIDSLKVDPKVKDELKKLSPFNYTGKGF